MQATLIRMSRDMTVPVHGHPREQWIYVLQGTLDAEVESFRGRVAEGSLLYIPAGAPHSVTVASDGDALYLAVKDTHRKAPRRLAHAILPRVVWNALRSARHAWSNWRGPRS